MDMNIETLKHTVDYGVIGLLVFMSFIAVWFFIERIFFYKKINISQWDFIFIILLITARK